MRYLRARHNDRVCLCTVVLGVFGTASAEGGPVLLGTVSNQIVLYGDAIVEEWVMNDVPAITVLMDREFFKGRLFEEGGLEVHLNDAPITMSDSVTSGDDPDFAMFARFLTDGISYGDDLFQDIRFLGRSGSEEIIQLHVPRFSEYDLYGYTLERIDRTLTLAMVSPGRDLNGDGRWTDFYVGGVYEFWGTTVPEPAALTLLGLGCLSLMHGRRRIFNRLG